MLLKGMLPGTTHSRTRMTTTHQKYPRKQAMSTHNKWRVNREDQYDIDSCPQVWIDGDNATFSIVAEQGIDSPKELAQRIATLLNLAENIPTEELGERVSVRRKINLNVKEFVDLTNQADAIAERVDVFAIDEMSGVYRLYAHGVDEPVYLTPFMPYARLKEFMQSNRAALSDFKRHGDTSKLPIWTP